MFFLQAGHSNNDPKIVASYFLSCVSHLEHTAKVLRTDCGTENGIVAGIQAWLHSSSSAHIYGKSTANQRIEALWSKFRSRILPWIHFFTNNDI